MARESAAADTVDEDDTDPLSVAYRHDVHKLVGRSHGSAREVVDGVRVNEPVPLGADADAALLSRPAGNPHQTVTNHCSPRRLSLLTGSPPPESDQFAVGTPAVLVDHLIKLTDPERLHAAWLTSRVAAAVTESVYYPYTSLKYHTLLVAALVDNYRDGFTFGELSLVAAAGASTTPTVEAALDADRVEPYRTVCWTSALTLQITGEPGDRPATPLGEFPARSFSDVWCRLPVHPIDVDSSREARVLDAQLRRIRSWSTALQYVEDVSRGVGVMSEWGGLSG